MGGVDIEYDDHDRLLKKNAHVDQMMITMGVMMMLIRMFVHVLILESADHDHHDQTMRACSNMGRCCHCLPASRVFPFLSHRCSPLSTFSLPASSSSSLSSSSLSSTSSSLSVPSSSSLSPLPSPSFSKTSECDCDSRLSN